jgi:hypothetical protein
MMTDCELHAQFLAQYRMTSEDYLRRVIPSDIPDQAFTVDEDNRLNFGWTNQERGYGADHKSPVWIHGYADDGRTPRLRVLLHVYVYGAHQGGDTAWKL